MSKHRTNTRLAGGFLFARSHVDRSLVVEDEEWAFVRTAFTY